MTFFQREKREEKRRRFTHKGQKNGDTFGVGWL